DTVQACGKKEIYRLCVKVLNLRSLAGVKESRWAKFSCTDSSLKGSWRCRYKLPVEKRTADSKNNPSPREDVSHSLEGTGGGAGKNKFPGLHPSSCPLNYILMSSCLTRLSALLFSAPPPQTTPGDTRTHAHTHTHVSVISFKTAVISHFSYAPVIPLDGVLDANSLSRPSENVRAGVPGRTGGPREDTPTHISLSEQVDPRAKQTAKHRGVVEAGKHQPPPTHARHCHRGGERQTETASSEAHEGSSHIGSRLGSSLKGPDFPGPLTREESQREREMGQFSREPSQLQSSAGRRCGGAQSNPIRRGVSSAERSSVLEKSVFLGLIQSSGERGCGLGRGSKMRHDSLSSILISNLVLPD
ncbi:hypothetical protein NHX12_026058, partial [Muraenolepis orangiensis]